MFYIKVSHEFIRWCDDLGIVFNSLAQWFAYFLNLFFLTPSHEELDQIQSY